MENLKVKNFNEANLEKGNLGKYKTKECLDKKYKENPELFNEWLTIEFVDWEGAMDDEEGKEASKDHPDRFYSVFNENNFVLPEKIGLTFDKKDEIIDTKYKNYGINLFDKSILEKNKDKKLSEIFSSDDFKNVQYQQSAHYQGLSNYLAYKGKAFEWNKNTTLGDILKNL